MPKSIIWLASYPKSGNTWLRVFLANYFLGADQPVPLAQISHVSFGDSALTPLAELAGRDPRELPPVELMALRHRRMHDISMRGDINFVKTHNANGQIAGARLIPPEVTRAAVLLVRDPRDVALSYADHWGIPPDAAAAQLRDPKNRIAHTPKTVAQYLGSWSDHAMGWIAAKDFPVIILRYEDLLAQPETSFTTLLKAIGAPIDRRIVAQSIAFSCFDAVSSQEAKAGFDEKGQAQTRFFREGSAGQWRDKMHPALSSQITEDHRGIMQKFGYI
ncbi:MAG: sulfotransferase domain-containing protein [Pseudomonadota bacterium]